MSLRHARILCCVGCLLLAACGGGGGGNTGATGSGGSSNITSVTVACAPVSLLSGQTSQCAATVTGTNSFGTAVTWNTSAGQVSSGGLLTAPVVSANQAVNVTATSTDDPTVSGTATVTVAPTPLANNVAPIVVDAGPSLQVPLVNLPFVSITICTSPGTNTCQTIDHVLVDTGSYGLRVLSSVLTIPLLQTYDSANNPLYECTTFLDGYVWGPVVSADVTVAGEQAAAVPVQVMTPPTVAPAVPASCSSQGGAGYGNIGSGVDSFGANAVLGIGVFAQDCGPACTTQNALIPPVYFACQSSGCQPVYVPLSQQVTNPVALFTSDNNGVLIQLPGVPDGGAANASGRLIFGIGTQANNGLGNADIYPVPASGNYAGDFTTDFNGTSYPGSFIDSGSNGLFFLDTTTTGIATCSAPNTSWYCPPVSPANLSAVNAGAGGQRGPATHIRVENAGYLFNTNNTAFSTLGGPNPGVFDWGLSFFYGRNVFIALENRYTPAGSGPYYAYNLP